MIKQGDLTSVEHMLAERANLAFYRDQKGATALHEALECGHVDIAWHFIENFPSLMTIKDFVSRTKFESFSRFIFLFVSSVRSNVSRNVQFD